MPINRPDVTQPDVAVQDRVATDTNRPDIVSMPDAMSMPDATSMPDAMSMPDVMSLPDGATGASAQIRAVQMAAAGMVDLPIEGVLVTYVVPAIAGATAGNDPAGFAVQADPTGPALFIAVDPATLMPAPTAGDRVSFRVTTTRAVNGGASRWASAISGYNRMSGSNPLAPMVQDLSSAADIASALGSYEYELVRLTGSITDNGANAGAAFRSFAITTAGIPTMDANLRMRIPQALATTLGLAAGCRVTLGPTPMWRFTAQAQPSAWRAADIMASGCPAIMDAGPEGGVDAAVDARADTGVIVDSGVDTGVRVDSGVITDSGVPTDTGVPMGDACVPRIVINEVQSRGGAGDANNEFVEIYNAGTCAVNLNGWTLRYAPASTSSGTGTAFWTGTASQTINPGQYAVARSMPVAAPPAGVVDLIVTSPLPASLGFNDVNGGVGLYNGSARIDGVTWVQMGGTGSINAMHPFREGNPATVPAMGGMVISASRIPNATDTDSNSADFAPRTMVTPGAANM
jgi:hypothetical protein